MLISKLGREKKCALQSHDEKTPYSQRTSREEISVPGLNLTRMLDDLLEKGVIQVSKPKRLAEVGRIIDPKYYRYHRMVNHPLEKCITLKERIMRLIKNGTKY